MRYEEYERWVQRAAAAASPAARREFALDTIRRLHNCTEVLVRDELDASEQQLLAGLLAEIEVESPTKTPSLLRSLKESMLHDDVRAAGFHPNILWFLSALNDWAKYRHSVDPRYIGDIGIQMVNFLDCDAEIDITDVLALPQMVTEFERQRRLLGDV